MVAVRRCGDARTGRTATADMRAPDVDRPDAVLDSLEPLDVLVGNIPFRDMIQPAYAEMVASRSEEADGERSRLTSLPGR
jgi:hypothetical protein